MQSESIHPKQSKTCRIY